MDELLENLESLLVDCVEHHGYQDDWEAPISGVTIGQVKQLVEILKQHKSTGDFATYGTCNCRQIIG